MLASSRDDETSALSLLTQVLTWDARMTSLPALTSWQPPPPEGHTPGRQLRQASTMSRVRCGATGWPVVCLQILSLALTAAAAAGCLSTSPHIGLAYGLGTGQFNT